MQYELWRDLVACLPKGRTLFYYGRDQFASKLLSYLIASGQDLSALKRGRYKPLFDKPVLREFFAGKGGLVADQNELAHLCVPNITPWRLTVDRWGDMDVDWKWNQTSRKGYNLVLQLNFSNQHNAAFNRDVGACVNDLFHYRSHPVSKTSRTMAWARLDVDIETGEVMIEEIQTDYIRIFNRFANAPKIGSYHMKRLCDKHRKAYAKQGSLQSTLKTYRDKYLTDTKFWDEIMLAATIDFCVRELACKSLFMHQFESGACLKHIDGRKPPRSLYTKLPRKFCFEATEQSPSFLEAGIMPKGGRRKNKLKAIGGASFWSLDLTGAQVST